MRQLIRFGLVGATSNVTAYLIYLLITYLGLEPKIAMTILFVIGAAIGFYGNRKWTFAHQGDSTRAARRFLTAYATAYLLNLSIMWVAVDHMGIAHYLVQAVNIVVISALLFVAQKYWIFASSVAGDGSIGDDSTVRGR